MKGISPPADKDAIVKLQYWFFAFPTESFSLNDLVDALGIAKTTANRIVTELIKIGFLKKEVFGKIWRISTDKAHRFHLTRKVPFHLQLIYESDILLHIREEIQGIRSITLFGSYRKGDDTEESDLDIAVEVVDDRDVEVTQLGIMKKLGYRENVPVNLHIFSRNHIDLNLFANIANGIVLEGFLEVRP